MFDSGFKWKKRRTEKRNENRKSLIWQHEYKAKSYKRN